MLGRRPFLKGAGSLGAAGGLVGGFTNVNAEPLVHAEDVPEDPDDGATVRHFDVSAISLDIQYSPMGAHQPNGAMFVLDENKEEVRRVENVEPGSDPATRLIEPLVIRANKGDIIEVTFKNELDMHCSMHQTGLPYEAETSDGMAVGYNPDTTAAPGETITYRWYANRLGTFFFHDGASSPFVTQPFEEPGNANGMARGLFGSVVVEPEEATWTNPRTGEPLASGTRADIHVPDGTDHREFVIHYHDPQGVVTADGEEPTWPGSDTEQSTHAINYRAASTGMRIGEKPDCEDCDDPVTFYSSWVHGNPGGGDLVYEGYVGDPTKFVAVGAQLEENHVHHLHGHRWQEAQRPENPMEEEGDTIDSQSLGVGAAYEAYLTPAYGEDSAYPDRTFEEAFAIGAGGSHGAPGDYLFHCHLFPHYAEGMNGMMRLHDKEREDLVQLPNNEPPIPADSSRPSWQEIVGTTVSGDGSKPPKPPGENRAPNETEKEYFEPLVEGAPYADPCIEPERTVEYTTVALPANIVYNDSGDHDPKGRIFMLESARIRYHDDRPDRTFDYSDDVQKVRDGEMNPEPMVIRANVGDCIEITVKNELPQPVSHHVHFVSFDPLGSDSTMTGYNYDSGAAPGDSITYRWYADEEGTIFFHDHMVGVEYGMHGTFSTLAVEPAGSEWTDPYSGEPIVSGAQAMIDPPDAPAFREQTLLYQDFAQLVDRNGEFVTKRIQHNENQGVMALNYRNAPYYHRDDDDAAYVFSSARHGDPETPVLEAYEGDPIRIRLVQAAYEEQHNFSCHGLRLDRRGLTDAGSAPEIVGTSEGFTFGVNATRIPDRNDRNDDTFTASEAAPNAPDAGSPLDNPNGLPVTDFLCGSTIDSDLWNGMWGLIRVWGGTVNHLQPLPGTDGPDEVIDDDQLREMGHPAVYSDFSWNDHGQRAKLYYTEGADRTFPPDKNARQNNGVGQRPPKPPSPGDPCPDDAPVRRFDVCALRSDIRYNDYGDHDPYGLVYALEDDAEDIEHGLKNPEPLILRANKGDCVELTLKNCVDELDDVHFQADLITGEPDEVLGEDPNDFYHPEGRLIRDVHGTINRGIVRRGRVRDPECVTSEPITVDLEEQTASVTVTIDEGCEDVELSLAIYYKPSAPRVFDENVLQHLVDAETQSLDAGTYTFTVDLPDPTHPLARGNAEFPESLRMSMHPHKLRYDAQASDGATVGFNYDQTVAPGEEITYRWYADDEFGSLVLWDMADTRNHWHHGAFGKLIIEPERATYLDPESGKPLRDGAGDAAMIVSPEGVFREFAILMSDGMNIINPSGRCVFPAFEDEHAEEEADGASEGGSNHQSCNQLDDAEDHGFSAVNYRSEPFRHRLENDPAVHQVYSSAVHGDPNTPVFTAFLDDPVVFRTSLAGSKSRGSSFHLSNHHWPRYQDVENPPIVGVDDRFVPGRSIDLYIEDGAGGSAQSAGDHLYREMKEDRRLESGLWGIFRVLDRGDGHRDAPVVPLPTDDHHHHHLYRNYR